MKIVFLIAVLLAAAVVVGIIVSRRKDRRAGPSGPPARLAGPASGAGGTADAATPDEAPFAAGSDAAPMPELAGLRTLPRLAGAVGAMSISLDGREVLAIHGTESATLLDCATGAVLKTWSDICPPGMLEHFSNASFVHCGSRRLMVESHDDSDGQDRTTNYLIDLDKQSVNPIYDVEDGGDAIATGSVSGDGRFFAGFVVYGKEHPLLNLELGRRDSFGDHQLEPGTLWQPTAMSRDGRWFATDQGDDDVYIFERKPYVYQGEPDGETLGFYFAATCETSPIALDFSEDGQSLLIVQDDGAIVIVDLAAKSCRTIAPFGEADDTGEGRAVVDATWLNGRNQAMARLDAPAPGVALIDLEGAGGVLREWPLTAELTARLLIARTGGFGLAIGPDHLIHVVPLLDDDAAAESDAAEAEIG